MTLDVFRLKDSVVSEYRDYLQSFVQVLDPRIDEYVTEMLARGTLWPEAVLQLNPAFEMDLTLEELANQGLLTEETAKFFGPELRLYQHQREALDLGLQGTSYVVTTSTGSGKSLTYLLPIYDAIIRNDPSQHSVRALLIYPMNALINSQMEALQRFNAKNWPRLPGALRQLHRPDQRGGTKPHPTGTAPHPADQLRNGRVPAAASQRTFDAADGDQQPANAGNGRTALLPGPPRRRRCHAHPPVAGSGGPGTANGCHQRHHSVQRQAGQLAGRTEGNGGPIRFQFLWPANTAEQRS